MLLGLRVGELAALKQLHIVREEVRNQVTDQYEAVAHTGDYIFMRDGERLTPRRIAYVLEKYAKRQGLSSTVFKIIDTRK